MAPAKLHRLSWLLYDFANDPFSVVIITFVYPVYFITVVCTGFEELGDLLWGINVSLSMVLVAFLSPVLGAVADLSGAIEVSFYVVAVSLVASAGWLAIFAEETLPAKRLVSHNH